MTDLELWLRRHLATRVGLGTNDLPPDARWSELGIDSLAAVETAAAIQRRMGKVVPVEAFVALPTVSALAEAVTADDWAHRLESLSPVPPSLRRLRSVHPHANLQPEPHHDAPWPCHRILLTGATGVVGSRFLLEWLRQHDGEVVCVVRARTPRGGLRRIQRFVEVYGSVDGLGFDERVTALPGDLAQERFGWSVDTWRSVAESIDAVVHIGAITSLVTAHANLQDVNVGGTATAAELALATQSRAMLHVSSYSVFGSAITEPGPDLDERHFDVGQRHHIGYTRSKQESEEVVRRLGARGLRWRIARLGDVFGDSETGDYPFEMVGAASLYVQLVRLYEHVGAIPDTGEFWPVAVDDVARGLVHLLTTENRHGAVYHLQPDHSQRLGADVDTERFGVERLTLPAFLERVERTGSLEDRALSHLLFGAVREAPLPDRLRAVSTWALLDASPASSSQTVSRFVERLMAGAK